MTETTETVTKVSGCPADALPYSLFGERRPALTYFSMFDNFREDAPAYRLDAGPQAPAWMLTRMDTIREAFQHPELFSNKAVIPSVPEPAHRLLPHMVDPPEHTEWRRVMAPLFSPKAVAALEPWIRNRAQQIIEDLVARKSCDFVTDFAAQFPNSVFMDILGLPQSEVATFMAWENAILHGNHADPEDTERSFVAMKEVNSYFADLVTARRREPQDDLTTVATGFQIEGRPATDEELVSILTFLFIAGLDTVSIQLSYSFLHTATHPEDRARIVSDPESVEGYVEDFLRVYSFVTPARKVVKDVDFHGCPFKAGDMVYLPIASATRDPREFPDRPTEVDADRGSNRHIAFGAGPHRCLGSHLARLELKVAMQEWHRRIPDYQLAEGEDVIEHGQQIGLVNLPLRWG